MTKANEVDVEPDWLDLSDLSVVEAEAIWWLVEAMRVGAMREGRGLPWSMAEFVEDVQRRDGRNVNGWSRSTVEGRQALAAATARSDRRRRRRIVYGTSRPVVVVARESSPEVVWLRSLVEEAARVRLA